jgi:lambda family phage minor tail protein L
MPRPITNNVIAEKNAATCRPIWLYRINISDTPEVSGEEDLYFAESNENIDFFETNGGVNSPRTYLRWPIRHQGLGENTEGRTETPTIVAGNITREIQAFLEERDFLRGRKVTIRQVFADRLTNPLDYIEDVFVIDTVAVDQSRARFQLTSRAELLQVELPRRLQLRNHCPWKYKGLGCWHEDENGDPEQPAEFFADATPLIVKTVSGEGTNLTPAQPSARFAPVTLPNVDVSIDELVVDLRCTAPAAMTAASQIEIGSGGTHDTEELSLTDLTGLGITSSWQTFTIALSSFTDGGIDWSAVNWFRVYSGFSSAGPHTLEWRNPRIRVHKPFGAILDDLDTCNKTLAHCRLHGNQKQFGGMPSVPSVRRVILG